MSEYEYGVPCPIENSLITAKETAENICKMARISTFEPQKYPKAVWIIALEIFEYIRQDTMSIEIQEKMIAALKSSQNVLGHQRNPRENPEPYMLTLCSIAVVIFDYVELVKD